MKITQLFPVVSNEHNVEICHWFIANSNCNAAAPLTIFPPGFKFSRIYRQSTSQPRVKFDNK